MLLRVQKYLFLFFLFITFSNYAKAVTFQNYSELFECIETHNTFFGYKKNLTKCFEKKGITIEKDSLKLIKNEYGIIDNIIDLNLPKKEALKVKKPKKKLSEFFKKVLDPDFKEIQKKEDIFNKPSALSDEYKEKSFSLNDKNFKDLNNYIKRNPEDIYAITEDINILTYNNQYLSEFKREEILLNVYNSFDVAILASKVPPPTEAAAFGGAGGIVAVAAIAAAAGGGGGGSGGGSSAPTLSFATSSISVGECGSDITVTANLTSAHSDNVTVTYTVGGTATKDTDYEISSTTSTIVAGATSGSITINPRNDTTAETSETVTLAASVSGVSTTGSTSTTITIHDYVLKCNATAFTDQGTSSTMAARDEFINVEGSTAGTKIHPFELLNIHKAHAFNNGINDLDGTGITIHVHDFNCDENHAEFASKTVNSFGTFAADSSSNYHCNLVAGIAAGDFQNTSGTTGVMGIAHEADLFLTPVPWTGSPSGASKYEHHEDSYDAARAGGATVSNNSWGTANDDGGDPNSGVNVSEMSTIITNNSGSQSQDVTIASYLWGFNATLNNSGVNSTWLDMIDSMNDFQTAGGIFVFATGNSTNESDVSVYAGLPEFYSQLAEAYLAVGWVDVTNVSNRSSITSSHVSQLGNPCGSAAAYCLIADSRELNHAHWFDGTTSHYQKITGGGSSSASPMVSGILALMQQAFPNHTAEQVTDRILASAKNDWFTPTGTTTFTTHGASIKHGYHSTWGHGFPDAYAALSPLTSDMNPSAFGFASASGKSGSDGSGGSGSVPFSQVEKLAVSETGMIASSSFGDGIMNGLKGKTAYAYDALNGGFKYNVNDFINYDALTEQKIEYTLDQEINHLRNFKFSENKTAKDFNVYAGEFINFRDKYNRGLSLTLDQPNIALQNFNLYNNKDYKNPFTSENKGIGFNNKFYFFGNNILLGYNNSKFDSLTSVNENLVVPMETLALSINLDSDKFDLLSFTTGLIKEENTFLLSEGSGAFDLNDKDNLSKFYGSNFSKS